MTIDESGKLSTGYKALFASPMVGWFAMRYFKQSFMKIYYTDDYPAANLGWIAFFGVLGVLMDAFTDPLMAAITDSTTSKYGRRRPYMLGSSFYALVVLVLGFSCPRSLSGVSASVWYGCFHVAWKLADTGAIIPYDALSGELTPSTTERNSLYTWYESALVFGILLGIAIPGLIDIRPSDAGIAGVVDDDYENSCTDQPTDGCLMFPILAGAFGTMFVVAMVLLVIKTQERSIDSSSKPSTVAVVPGLVSCWLNRPFRILIVADIVEAVGGDLPYVVLPYLTKWVIGEASISSSLSFTILGGTNLIMRLVAIPLWLRISKSLGKFKTYLTHVFLLIISHSLFLFIGYDSIAISAALRVVWGIIYAGHYFSFEINSR